MEKDVKLDEELKGFLIDICFDYKKQPELGLLAIRTLLKGKQTEERFFEVWQEWLSRRITKGEKE